MKKFFVTMSVLGLLSLLISCGDIADSSADKAAPNGKARVSFSLGQIANRVIDPLNITAQDISRLELTAQKLSDEDKYESYKFGESEALSWESISIMEKASVTLDFGTYNFTLKLFTLKEDGKTEFVVQTAKLEGQIIDSSTKTLEFNAEYKDSGDVKITVSWKLLEDLSDPCRINKIESAFYTIDSFGKDLAGEIEKKSFVISEEDVTDDKLEKIASASYTEVPNGSYIIKLFLYNSKTATEPFDTITDIIKVNGYKTLYDLKLDPNELNVQYEAVFDPNGGTWEGGSNEPITTTRNMYSGFIPPKEVSKDGFVLVGWYAFEGGEPSEDLSQGISSDDITVGPEMGARDYTFYAIWGHSVGGNLSTDNRALIIKTDAGDTIYQNSKINLSVTDSAGEPVTNGVTYDAKILYKGKDINDLGGKEYYTVAGTQGVITLNGMTTPLPEANYQLYVTASRAIAGNTGFPVTSSQTFNVKLLDGVETQIALYNKSSGAYNYYLKDSDKVDEELGEQTLGANMAKSAFDASGYFYVAEYNDSGLNPGVRIFSTNPVKPSGSDVSPFKSGGVQLPLEDGDGTSNGTYCDFAIDMTTNILYGCAVNMTSLYLYKYPNLISSASNEGCVAYNYINVSEGYFYPSQIAINDNTLYVFGYWTDNDNQNATWRVMVYDIPESGSFGDVKYTCDLDSKLIEKDSKLSYAKIIVNNGSVSPSPYGDMYAMDGALYLVLKPFTAWTVSNPNIYSGAIVKWVPGESEVTVRGLYSEKTVAQESITQMYLNYVEGNPQTVYATSERKTLKTMLADSTSYNNKGGNGENYGIADGYKFFPNVYAMSAKSSLLDTSAFVGPTKIIGIKPKKLVIADDGYAFYTDSDMLYYKNVNRVVTIDLERFVIESVQATEATFDSELTDYFKSGSSIDKIRSGATYYDYGATVYYYDSSSREDSGTIGFGSNFYLAVKNGDNQ